MDSETKQELLTMALLMRKGREQEEARKKAEAEAEEKWRQEQYWNTGVMPLGNFRMENGKVVERNGKPMNE